MRISVTVFVILITTYVINASVLDPVIENVVHLQASKPPSGVFGIWKKKTIWKPRWVKEWKSAKVTKPVWKKVWSPVQIREWVPIPKPPPGWDAISTPLAPAKPVKAVKTVHKEDIPLWDPMPYPESQQPPPPPQHDADVSCPHGGCGGPSSLAFSRQQIAELITSHKYKQAPVNFQSADYSETITHLTRPPPNSNNWRSFQQQPFNQFNNFPELPPFLVPPKFEPFISNDLSQQFRNHQQHHASHYNINRPSDNVQVSQSPGFEVNPIHNNRLHQWIPLPPLNKNKGDEHLQIRPPQPPYQFQQPEGHNEGNNNINNHNGSREKETSLNLENELNGKPEFQTHKTNNKLHPHATTDLIQQAQLVGEYHYSEFDMTKKVESEPKNVETKSEFKEEIKSKPPEKSNPIQAVQESGPGFGSTELKSNLPPPIIESKPPQIRHDVRKPQLFIGVQHNQQKQTRVPEHHHVHAPKQEPKRGPRPQQPQIHQQRPQQQPQYVPRPQLEHTQQQQWLQPGQNQAQRPQQQPQQVSQPKPGQQQQRPQQQPQYVPHPQQRLQPGQNQAQRPQQQPQQMSQPKPGQIQQGQRSEQNKARPPQQQPSQIQQSQQQPQHVPRSRPEQYQAQQQPKASQPRPKQIQQQPQYVPRPQPENTQQRPQQQPQQVSPPKPEQTQQHHLQWTQPNSDFQIQKAIAKEINFKIPLTFNSTLFPTNHRFSLNPDSKSPEKSFSSSPNPNSFNRLITLAPDKYLEQPKTEKNSKTENNFNLHVVYPMLTAQTPIFKDSTEVVPPEAASNSYAENVYVASTTETTTPSTFPSSFFSNKTTNTTTEGSVFIVTPTYTIKS